MTYLVTDTDDYWSLNSRRRRLSDRVALWSAGERLAGRVPPAHPERWANAGAAD